MNISIRFRGNKLFYTSLRSFFPSCFMNTVSKDVIESLERNALVDFDTEASLVRLEKAIKFADQLMEVDVTGVKPLFSTVYERNENLRSDIVLENSNRKELMKVAPVTEEFYYVAPAGAFSRTNE